MFLVNLWKSALWGKDREETLMFLRYKTLTSNSDCLCDAGIVNVTDFKVMSNLRLLLWKK